MRLQMFNDSFQVPPGVLKMRLDLRPRHAAKPSSCRHSRFATERHPDEQPLGRAAG